MYQLPPVISDEEIFLYTQHDYEGVYFFNAKVWQLAHLEIYELQEIFRQKDDSFKDILNAIRVGRLTPEILKTLNTRCSKPAMGMITLATTNATVASINEEKLNGLDDKEHTYMATISGDFDRNSYPTEEKLTLKVGAQIMMLKNDQDRRWVNGTIGRIFSLNKEDIKVFIDGKTYTVKPESWNKINYVLNEKTGVVEEQVIASFTQYPLRLAWAITIHKSQGQTYEKIYLDLGRGAFAHGQTYVALSRAVSLEGLFLARPIRTSDIILDPQIVNFMRSAKISTL